ncbi:MAG: DUF4870 domain-containing protein [Puniceicoccaceae bacterium]
MTTPTNDKLWNVLCHLSVWLGVGIILPLIVYLVTKDDPESSIPAHAKESLNFHISMYIYGLISLLLFVVVIGMILLPLIALATAVLSVVGAVKASNGEVYQYPATIRLVK